MAGASRAMFIADERATAESIARSQMEYVKNQQYDDSGIYDEIADIPAGYDIEITTVEKDDGIQKITITVYHNGEPVLTSPDYTLEGYKVER